VTTTTDSTAPLGAATALAHLWPHSDDAQWGELLDGGALGIFESGHGSTLVDREGHEYIDALAGLFLVNIGHGRAEVGEVMARQAARLAYTAASNTANTSAIALADKVAELTPGDLDRVFLCSGGSEAVESALKIAKQVQVLRGYPKRYKVICRRGSYHGTTAGAMSLTSSASERYFGPFAPGVSKVPSPNRYRNDFGLDGEAGDLMCARYLEQEIVNQGSEHVAAVIAEPISVSNGTHLPSPAYWQELRAICDRHGVLLIMDEVVTGYGRSGTMFAAERYGVVPDLMTMAKGISSGYAPVGAVAVRSSVFEPFAQDGSAFGHLLTFGGHAVAAAAARKNIEIIENERLVERSAAQGERLFALAEALRSHPTVGDVRGGTGLMCAIELVKDAETKQSWGASHPFIKGVAAGLRKRGVITRVWDVLHLAPPFVVTDAELERIVEVIDDTLTELEREHAHELG
jgi:adenosylmethionine-8-amino-7-oxononanoate aminotransferase